MRGSGHVRDHTNGAWQIHCRQADEIPDFVPDGLVAERATG